MATNNIKREVMIRIYIGFLFIVLLSGGIIAKVVHTQLYDAHRLIAESDSLSIYEDGTR
jgi:cell division protein FtsI/penicillin-binding protein 2